MDIQALKSDVQIALRRLPRQFILDVAGAVAENKDILFREFPKILDELKPHLKAGIMEGALGTLDVAELETAFKELLADFVNVDLNTTGPVESEA